MLRLYLNGALFWSSRDSDLASEYAVFDLKTKEEANSVGLMTFSITKLHPLYSSIHQGSSVFILASSKKAPAQSSGYKRDILFIGKVSKMQVGMDFMASIEVEDFLSALRDNVCNGDSMYGTTDKKMNATYGYILDRVFDALSHINKTGTYLDDLNNGTVNGNARNLMDNGNVFNVARGTIQYPQDRDGVLINPSSSIKLDTTQNLWDLLFNELIGDSQTIVSLTCQYTNDNKDLDSTISSSEFKVSLNLYSAYVDVSSESGGLYNISNDVFTGDGEDPIDVFEYGDNLLSFEIEPAVSNSISGIKIIGTDSEGYYFGPAQIDSGDNFHSMIWSENMINKYGLLSETIDFGQVNYKDFNYGSITERKSARSVLYSRAKIYASYRLRDYGDKLTVNGVSNYYTDTSNADPIHLCSPVAVRSIPHNLDFKSICLSKEIDYFHHENDRYIIGPYIPDNLFDYKISES